MDPGPMIKPRLFATVAVMKRRQIDLRDKTSILAVAVMKLRLSTIQHELDIDVAQRCYNPGTR